MEDSHSNLKSIGDLIKMVEIKNQAILNKIVDPADNFSEKHSEQSAK